MNPLVSIIIPTFNRAHLISETLSSILSQTYTNWECIIIDDGSTDDTQMVVTSFINKDFRFKYFKRPNKKVKGPSSCRNYGFELSKGTYVSWFDDDDVMKFDAIEKRLSFFEMKTDVVICKLQHYDFERNIILNETNIFSDNIIGDYLIGILLYFVSGPIWKRDFLLKQNELFDETLTNFDDWDFNLRMLYTKPKIVLVNEALINYRVHDNSLSQQINKFNFKEIKSEFRARVKHLCLLNFKRNIDIKKFRKITISRNKFFLREALIVNNKTKYYLFKTLIISQLIDFDLIGLFKSISGFFSYGIINKGYIFFR